MNIEIKHLWLHKCPKKWNQYTLIALVITIIVLLILAGVTVVTLTGDNGLIQKATTAKEANEEAAVLEKIKTEVAGSYNLEGKIDLNELKTNLKKLNIPDEDIIPTIKNEKETFPMIVKVNMYSIDILENGTVEKTPNFETLESLYGKVVNGYTGYEATDVTEWKLLYVDEENRDAIIIASESSRHGKVQLNNSNNQQYSGCQDVQSWEYGKNYNGLWLELCEEASNNNNEKTTAYLCDPNNWADYVTGKAKYAAGGPTEEILFASRYDKQIKDFKNSSYTGNGSNIRQVNRTGYPAGEKGFTTDIRNKLYNNGNNYFLASPASQHGNYAIYLYASGNNSNCTNATALYADWIDYYFRPVVCLPASAIEVVGEGENAVLNYK